MALEKSILAKRKAQKLAREGQIQDAIEEMRHLLGEGEVDPYDHVYLGDLLIRIGEQEEALQAYSEAVRCYEQTGLLRNAIAVCKKILRLDSGRSKVHRSLGELYDREGLLSEAVPHYLVYLDSFKGDSLPPDEFFDTLERAAALSGQQVEVALRLADHFQRVNRGERAAALLEEVALRVEGSESAEMAADLRQRAAALRGAAGVELQERRPFAQPAEPRDEERATTPAVAAASPLPFELELDFGLEPAPAPPPEAPPEEPAAEAPPAFDWASLAEEHEAPAPMPPPPEPQPEVASPFTSFALGSEPPEAEPPRVEPPQAEPSRPLEPADPPVVVPHAEVVYDIELDAGDEPMTLVPIDVGAEEAPASEPPSLRERAAFAFENGAWDEARGLYLQIHRENPDATDPLERLADIAVAQKDPAGEALYQGLLGDAWIQRDELTKAEAAFRRVLELQPDNATAARRMARFRDLGVTAAETAGEEPEPPQGVLGMRASVVDVKEGDGAQTDEWLDLESLLEEFKAGLKNHMDASDFQGHYDLALSHHQMGLLEESLEELDRVLECPDLPLSVEQPARELRGLCLMGLERGREAVHEFREAAEKASDPQAQSTARYHLARALESVEEWQEACESLEMLLRQTPGFLDAEERLRRCRQALAGTGSPPPSA